MSSSLLLLVASLPSASSSAGPSGLTFELGRIQSPLDWLLPIAVVVVLAWFVIGMYLLDCRELGGRLATLLIGLRLLALLGLVAVYLQPQWRARRDVVNNSRVLLLVDTSQSMQRRDGGSAFASTAEKAVPLRAGQGDKPVPYSFLVKMLPYLEKGDRKSRIEDVVDELTHGTLLPQLRRVHDVVVYRFDEGDRPAMVATLPRLEPSPAKDPNGGHAGSPLESDISRMRMALGVAAVVGLLGLLALGAYLAHPVVKGRPPRWLLPMAALDLAIAVGMTCWAFSAKPPVPFSVLIGLDSAKSPRDILAAPSPAEAAAAGSKFAAGSPDWKEVLTARGAETRLGQAISRLVQDERSMPVAGIVVFTDGQQNAGLACEAAEKAASEAHIPIYTVGLGTQSEGSRVRLANFQAPELAYPGDYFEVTAFLSARGLAGRSATVRLRQVPLKEPGQPVAPSIGLDQQRDVLVGTNQEDLAVKFEVPGIKVPGRYGFELSVEGVSAAVNETDARQLFQIAIVDRRTKVLLMAGGPGREYRFLRSLLRRDKQHIALDVLLQSSSVEKSQNDYPKNLSTFPDTRDKLFDYDCIIALDPDWKRLDDNQVSLLEKWVAEQAGGLIVAPGRVYAGSAVKSWLNESRLAPIRALYPVEFQNLFFQADEVGHKSTQVQPLELTREGAEAEFLRLDDNPVENQRIWSRSFAGVYGALPVRAVAKGATVYAHYGDARAATGDTEPVYFAGRFYGSGSVFYLGSPEMWRLREVDEAHFERFYTKLVRYVSQRRLLRGSRRGDVLLLEANQYHLGDNVPVAADLKNAQREPLEAERVTLFLFEPGSTKGTPLEMVRDQARKGMYHAQFIARREGDYRLELPLPETNAEPLSHVLKVTPSALERENTDRNDALLMSLARATGGRYFVGVDAALGRQSDAPVASLLKDQTQITPVLGDRDPRWEAFWSRLMMFGICGVLCLEWLLRRLFKLA